MKKILVLGGSSYNKESISSLVQMGLEVHVADGDPNAGAFGLAARDHVLDIKSHEQVLDLANILEVDAIIPSNDFSVQAAASVSNALGLRGISVTSALLSTDKAEMRKVWHKNGLPNPRFHIVEDFQDMNGAIQDLGFPVILKPAHGIGGGSRGVIVISREDDLLKGFSHATSFYAKKTLLVEEYLQSISEHSIEVVVQNGDVNVLGVSEKVKYDPPFRVDKAVIYPANLNAVQMIQIQDIAESVCKSFGISNGVAHIEIGWTRRGPILFEAASRCGGGAIPSVILPYLTGINQFSTYASILLGEKVDLHPTKVDKSVGYYFVAPKPGIIRSVEFLHDFESDMRILEYDLCAIRAGKEIRPVKFGSERSGYFVLSGDSNDSIIEYGKLLENAIQIQYEE